MEEVAAWLSSLDTTGILPTTGLLAWVHRLTLPMGAGTSSKDGSRHISPYR
jgi:hypothetical protein